MLDLSFQCSKWLTLPPLNATNVSPKMVFPWNVLAVYPTTKNSIRRRSVKTNLCCTASYRVVPVNGWVWSKCLRSAHLRTLLFAAVIMSSGYENGDNHSRWKISKIFIARRFRRLRNTMDGARHFHRKYQRIASEPSYTEMFVHILLIQLTPVDIFYRQTILRLKRCCRRSAQV